MVKEYLKIRREAQKKLISRQMMGSHSEDENASSSTTASPTTRRMAIIDGCNVIHSAADLTLHAQYCCEPSINGKKKPDAIGVLQLMRQLLMGGWDVLAIVRNSAMFEDRVDHWFIHERLRELGLLQVVQNTYQQLNDDKDILIAAAENDGYVISNDKFHDHFIRKSAPESVLNVIESRLISYKSKRVPLSALPGQLNSKEQRYFTGMEIELIHTPASSSKGSPIMIIPNATPTPTTISKTNELLLKELSFIYDYLHQRLCIAIGVRPPPLPFFHATFDDLPWRFNDFLQLKNIKEAMNKYEEEEEEEVVGVEEPDSDEAKIKRALTAYGKMPSLKKAVLDRWEKRRRGDIRE